MIRENFDKKLYKDVLKEYKNGTDIDILCCLFGLEKYEILGFLNQPEVDQSKLISELPMKEFDSDKVILISDTHIGSYSDKSAYLEYVNDYATANGIKDIIHGGDLLHSTKKNVKKYCWRPNEQILYLLDYLNDDLNYHILFGNHDYHAFKKDEKALRIIESQKNIDILGFKRAYFTFASKLFSIMHKCDKYPLNLPNVDTFINFYGHRHECKVEGDNSIWIPTLSEDVKEYGESIFDPGFLTMEKHEEQIDVYKHSLGRDTTKILTKRYK